METSEDGAMTGRAILVVRPIAAAGENPPISVA
jgi:hypothetical protein